MIVDSHVRDIAPDLPHSLYVDAPVMNPVTVDQLLKVTYAADVDMIVQGQFLYFKEPNHRRRPARYADLRQSRLSKRSTGMLKSQLAAARFWVVVSNAPLFSCPWLDASAERDCYNFTHSKA